MCMCAEYTARMRSGKGDGCEMGHGLFRVSGPLVSAHFMPAHTSKMHEFTASGMAVRC